MATGRYHTKYKSTLTEQQLEELTKMPIVQVSDEMRATYEDGKVLLIDKPLHWTSFDAVKKIRNTLKIKKVGHAGTLDPLATGLLIICTGKYTKKINEYMAAEKGYTGSFTLGATTATYDKESIPENIKPVQHLSTNDIIQAATQFVGSINQYPPIYSAIKKNGEALYELARRGEAVELKARTITIYTFEITAIDMPIVSFRVTCSTGTYIRSLAHDMGAALGCGAYLSELRRVSIGDSLVDDALCIEEFLQQVAIHP